ncbi:hypothetical protein [uncultured Dysosmobacter sp.]|uniref:hypothetical protein n=1 Tax=uncultured Dysosmobacter sp. TaxID=2591384 RepID=UPI002616C495|nr:hypothetical protein [uncultured Dysosmobacter sp.]
MITSATLFNFQRQYCAYYRTLEEDFVATEKYLTVNKDNFSAYSNEFVKLLQATCSELDVMLKGLCRLIDPKFKGETINTYCKCILDSNPHFVRANVSLIRVQEIMLAPWGEWHCTEKSVTNGKVVIEVDNPNWWTMYNKIKHDRTKVCPSSKKPYYKYANQENVLNALAALYIVISYILHMLCQYIRQEDASHFLTEWYTGSKLFNGGFAVTGISKIPNATSPWD